MSLGFKRGMKVKKTFQGIDGYTEVTEQLVAKVSKGVVYLANNGSIDDPETGITYDAKTGKELENFFPGMSTSIVPDLSVSSERVTIKPKKKKAKASRRDLR